MKRYEVWTPRGAVGSWTDKALADKAFRRQESPALLTLGVTVLSAREGTTPRQREEIEALVKAAHPAEEKIAVPTPDPAREQTHRTRPVTAAATAARRRPIETDDEDDADEDDAQDESRDDDADDELPTADAPRTTDDTAVEQPAAPAPTTPEVPMASKSTPAVTCAVRGCNNHIGAVRGESSWRGAFCRACRDRGRKAIEEGRATEATVAAHLKGSDRRDTSAAPKARTGKPKTARKTARKGPPIKRKVARRPTKTSKARVAPDQAVELCDGSIQVTIALPDDVARAHRCALAVGLQALEALATLRSNSTIAEINEVISQLPERD